MLLFYAIGKLQADLVAEVEAWTLSVGQYRPLSKHWTVQQTGQGIRGDQGSTLFQA